MEDDVIRSYMRGKLCGGKNRFARALDYVALRLILFISAYYLYLPRFASRPRAMLLAAITLAMAMLLLHLGGEIRYERFCQRELTRVRKLLLQDRLSMLDMQSAIPLVSSLCPVGATPVVLQRALPVNADALLAIRRTHAACGELHVFSCTPYDEAARAYAARTNGLLVLHAPDELLSAALRADMRPSDDEVYEAIAAQLAYEKTRRRRRLPTPFATGGACKYALLALLLTALSFLTSYALYYRLLAGLCMTVAALGAWRNRTAG